ncbi:enolase C-terminal domain-like protein [Streptomyces sp. YGL11-2]
MAAAVRIAVDANQRWDVAEAVRWMTAPAPYTPYWIEGEDGASPALAESATGHLTAGERAAVFGRTAGRVYGIGA